MGSEKYRVQLTTGLDQNHDSFMASFCEHGDVHLRYVKEENRILCFVDCA